MLHFINAHCTLHIWCRVRQLKILNQCIKRENRAKESPYFDVQNEGYDQLKEPPGYTNTNVRRSKLFRVLRQLPSTWELKNVKRYWKQYDEGSQYITNVYHGNYMCWYTEWKKNVMVIAKIKEMTRSLLNDILWYVGYERWHTPLLLGQCETNKRLKSKNDVNYMYVLVFDVGSTVYVRITYYLFVWSVAVPINFPLS